MIWIGGILLAIALLVPWLRGSWIVATLFSFPITALFIAATSWGAGWLALMCLGCLAAAWVPFAIWRRVIRQRDAAAPPATTRALMGIEVTR